jgi:hypothetical protein
MLIHDEDNDYTLPETEDSCWLTINNLFVYIVRRPNGIIIEVTNTNDFDYTLLQKTYTPFHEDTY